MSGQATLDVAPELLHELLRLPASAEITFAGWNEDNSCVSLLITDETFSDGDHERRIDAFWVRQEPVLLTKWEVRA